MIIFGAPTALVLGRSEPAETQAAWLALATATCLSTAAATAAAGVLVAGGISVGWPPWWERLPGSYTVDGFAQLWLVPAKGSHSTLGIRDQYPGRRVFRLTLRGTAKTVTTWELTMAYGDTWQRTVTAPGGGKQAATLTTPDRVISVTS
jgi:hypothetical protein